MPERFTIRQAAGDDVAAILDLLTHYDLPRNAFEPLYREDPSYTPEQSWVLEEDGRLLAHLRVYHRRMRLHGVVVPMGGIGNVVTARDARGRGVAGALLRRVCAHLDRHYAVSLLWTHAPRLYAAHGWVPVPQEIVITEMRDHGLEQAMPVIRGSDDDVDDALELLSAADANRTGTEPRTREWWFAQRAWLQEEVAAFTLVRDSAGSLRGYLRGRRWDHGVDVLELGAMPGDTAVARALLMHAVHGARRLRLTLPPSLRTAVRDHEVVERAPSQLMLRLCSGDVLAAHGGERMRARVAVLGSLEAERGAVLLLYGSGVMGASVDDRDDATALRHLFPPQDTVLWQSDRF